MHWDHVFVTKMAANIKNCDWMKDRMLKDDLSRYVRQNWKTSEILDFMELKYPMYAWSERTLARRLQYFDIKFTNYEAFSCTDFLVCASIYSH